MYWQSFNYLVLMLVVLVTVEVILLFLWLLLLLPAVKTFALVWRTGNVTYLAPHFERNFVSTSTVYRENNLTASKSGLNIVMTFHIRPESELRMQGPLPLYANFTVQFLSREIFIYIIIVVVVVIMISVIIVTGIEEIRRKVAKIFRLAEAGPVQSLSFFFISSYSLFHLVHL